MHEAASAMGHELVFRTRARKDVHNAVQWYAAKREGLGGQFLLELQRCLGGIASNPRRHPKIYSEFRQARVKRFPYVVVYRPLDREVVVMRVFHTKQDHRKKFIRK